MEKYRLVQEHKAPEVSDMFQQEDSTATGAATAAAATGDAGFPVVRITQQGKPRNYISYAMGLFVSCHSIAPVPSHRVGVCILTQVSLQ
jgi:hypothetical protein